MPYSYVFYFSNMYDSRSPHHITRENLTCSQALRFCFRFSVDSTSSFSDKYYIVRKFLFVRLHDIVYKVVATLCHYQQAICI